MLVITLGHGRAGTTRARHHASSFIIQGLRIQLHTKPHAEHVLGQFGCNGNKDCRLRLGFLAEVYVVRTYWTHVRRRTEAQDREPVGGETGSEPLRLNPNGP